MGITRNMLPNRDPANVFFDKCKKYAFSVIFHTYAGTVTDRIIKCRRYQIRVGSLDYLDKHDILFCYKAEYAAQVTQSIAVDDDVVEEALNTAELKKTERLKIPLDVLEEAKTTQRPIEVTMRNGTVLRGRLHRYGAFSLRVSVAKKVRVVVQTCNIYDLLVKKGQP